MLINDMPDDIMSSIKIFADDTKAFKDVQTDDDICLYCRRMWTHCVIGLSSGNSNSMQQNVHT